MLGFPLQSTSFFVSDLLSWENLIVLAKSLFVLGLGLIIAKLFTEAIGSAIKRRSSPQQNMVVRRISYYTLAALAAASALTELGIDLSVLLGAAGLFTVALGFASRTSASNLISGLFLIGEQSFVVSDIIICDGHTGEVISIDLLSVKLKTFDNRYVRVPNEKLLSSSIVNLSRFPIRRADLHLRVDYDENLEEIKDVLISLSNRNPVCLAEPEPLFLIKGFGEYGVDIQFSIWTTQTNYITARNQIQAEITKAFADGTIPLPKLHKLVVSDPLENDA